MNSTIAWPKWLGPILIPLALAACGGGGGGGGSDTKSTIDPADSDSVAEALAVKFGGQEAERQESGEPPSSDPSNPDNPVLKDLTESETVEPSDSKSVSFSTEEQSPLAFLYAKVTGSSRGFFRADVSQTQSLTKASFSDLVFDIPERLGAGEFCVRLSVEDTQGRVSEPNTVCFVSQPPENAPQVVLARLQGKWFRCMDGEGEQLTFEGDQVTSQSAQFQNADCTGTQSQNVFTEVLDFEIGKPLTTAGGLSANRVNAVIIESDDSNAVGDRIFDIVRVEESRLVFGGAETGAPPESRPDTLRLDMAYGRLPPDDNTGGDTTPREDQTWQFRISGTVNGENFEQQSFEVTGLSVPFEEPTEEQVVLTDDFTAAFSQACDEFDGTQDVREIRYSFNGDGSVGSVVDFFLDILIDGTCTRDGESSDVFIDAQLSYQWERTQ